MADSDPPKDEDEWEEKEEEYDGGTDNGSAASAAAVAVAPAAKEVEEYDDKLGDLKRCLVDTVYGTELGFRAGSDVRAEVLELVNQLEALNPTPNPVNAAGVLDGNWVLV